MLIEVRKTSVYADEETTVNCIGGEWLNNAIFSDTEMADNMVRYNYVKPISVKKGMELLKNITNSEYIDAIETAVNRHNVNDIYIDYYEDMAVVGIIEDYDETDLEMTLIYCELFSDVYNIQTKVRHSKSGIYYKVAEYIYKYTI